MKNNTLRSILTGIAKEAAPSAEINLWEKISQRLAKSESRFNKKGKTLMKPNFDQSPVVRRVAIAVLAVVFALAILMAATPQGRAWAQTVLYFFQHGNGIPVATSAPAQATSVVYNLTPEEAQELAGFEVRVPVVVPAGYQLSDVYFDSQTGEVGQLYKFQPYQAGEMFILQQSPTNSIITIGEHTTVEQVQVGDTLVEYVGGMWFAEAGAAWETWDTATPLHTFRWEQAGSFFTLQFYAGDTFSPAYLSRETMQAMVEVVLGLQTALSDTVNLNNLTSYEAVESATGFDILTPSVIPEGFVFSHAAYEPDVQRVVLVYRLEDSARTTSGTELVIFETPVNPDAPAASWDGFPAEAVETVDINSAAGTLVRGAIVDDVYDPDFGMSITWETGGLHVQVRFTGSDSPTQVDQAALLDFARSMK